MTHDLIVRGGQGLEIGDSLAPLLERMGTTHGVHVALIDESFVIVDVETTGVSPRRNRITEIAAVRLVRGAVAERFHTLVNPERSIPQTVTAITGISDRTVAEAPRFCDVADELTTFLGGFTLVAHNVRFDWRFLCAELARISITQPTCARLCTLRIARQVTPGMQSYTLSVLTQHFHLSPQPAHRAGADAEATAELFLHLLHLLKRSGVLTRSDLRRWMTRS